MTSEAQQVFVWCHLPGDTAPTLAGRLDVDGTAGGETVASFVYGRSYLANPHALPLEPFRLPLRPARFHAVSTARQEVDLFGVIADALPDAWGRYVIERRHGHQPFPSGYLLRSQDDRVGHLSFSPSATEPPALGRLNGLDRLEQAWRVVSGLESNQPVPADLEDLVRPNTGMGGAKPKLTLTSGDAQWLVKFPSNRDDRRFSETRAEAGLLDLAGLCGIQAATAQLAPLKPARGRATPGGTHPAALMVRRFDRTATAGGWLRDAYVSARTVIQSDSARSAQQFMGTYPQFCEQLQRWSSRPTEDRHELFRRLVFNCCVSNTDDHDRKHGLLADEGGHLYRLAPAFDLTPRIHGTRRRLQAMAFGDHGAEATRVNLLSAAPHFDLDASAAQLTVDEIETLVQENWQSCLEARGLTRTELEALAPCFAPLPDQGPAPRHFVP